MKLNLFPEEFGCSILSLYVFIKPNINTEGENMFLVIMSAFTFQCNLEYAAPNEQDLLGQYRKFRSQTLVKLTNNKRDE